MKTNKNSKFPPKRRSHLHKSLGIPDNNVNNNICLQPLQSINLHDKWNIPDWKINGTYFAKSINCCLSLMKYHECNINKNTIHIIHMYEKTISMTNTITKNHESTYNVQMLMHVCT